MSVVGGWCFFGWVCTVEVVGFEKFLFMFLFQKTDAIG